MMEEIKGILKSLKNISVKRIREKEQIKHDREESTIKVPLNNKDLEAKEDPHKE